METKSRFLKIPKSSFFLFGPRGTGKSLWLKQTFPKSIYLDFLSPEVFRAYASSPERLETVIAGNPAQKNIIIDEVQKVPEVLSVVHKMIEKDKTLRFVLTGSSSRKLKRTGVDLLGGRAAIKTLHPFMAAELGKDFHLETALEQGLLPLVWAAQDPKVTLGAYIGLYLREEVKMEGMVRNIGAFTRFLETLSLSHGSILSLSEIARECEVERKTVEGYISVLEHIEDDARALDNIRLLLKQEGRLVLMVPALPAIYGTLDKLVGHYRRYTKKTLTPLLQNHGFKIERQFYMNIFGVVSWFTAGRILKYKIFDPVSCRRLDRFVPIFEKLETFVKPVIGQSLITVCRKNEAYAR